MSRKHVERDARAGVCSEVGCIAEHVDLLLVVAVHRCPVAGVAERAAVVVKLALALLWKCADEKLHEGLVREGGSVDLTEGRVDAG